MELRYKVYSSRYGLYNIFNKHKIFFIGLVLSLFLFAGFSLAQVFAAGQATVPSVTDPSAPVTVSLDNYAIKGTTPNSSGTVRIYKDVNNDGDIDTPDDTVVASTSSLTSNNFSVSVSLDLGANNFLATYDQPPAKSESSPVNVPTITYEVAVDTTPPEVPVHESPEDGSFRTTASQTLIDWSDVSDPSSPVKYKYESSHSPATNPDGSFTSPVYTSGILSSSEIPTPGTPEGVYHWHVKAIDDAGNESDWSSAWTFTVDNTKPATTWDETGPITTNNPTISGNSTDNLSGVDVVELQIEDSSGVVQPWTVTNVVPTDGTFDSNDEDFNASPATFLSDGTYIFKTRATDKAGNVESTAIIEVTIDTTPPGIPVLTSPADGVPINGTSPIANDWEDVVDADSYIYQSYNVNGSGDCILSPPRFTATYNDSQTNSRTLSDELKFCWRVKAVDAIGNESDWSEMWKTIADNTGPSTPVNGLPNGTYEPDNEFDFTWDASTDNIGPVKYEYQASQNPAQSGGILTTNLWQSGVLATNMIHSSGAPDGIWYWQVRAKDAAGNYSQWSEIWEMTIDSVAPGIPIHESPADGSFKTTANQLLVDWSDVSDTSPVTYRYQSSHSPDTNPDGSFVAPVYTSGILSVSEIPTPGTSEGTYYWHVKAVDAAGHESAWSTAWTIVVDNTKPATTWDDGGSITTNESNPTFTGNATDNLSGVASVELRIENKSGSPVQDWTSTNVIPTDGAFDDIDEDFSASPASPPLGDGTYTFLARAIDAAGNIESTATMIVTVDTTSTPPQNNNSNNNPNSSNNSKNNNSNNSNASTTAFNTTPFNTFGTFGTTPAGDGNVLSDTDENNNGNEENNNGGEVQADSAGISSAATTAEAVSKFSWSWWWLLPILAALLILLALWRRREDEEEAA